MSSISVVDATAAQADRIGSGDRGLEAREHGPVFGRFGRGYYPKAAPVAPVDRSFAVLIDDQPVLLIDCDVAEATLARYGFPAQVWVASDADATAVATASSHAFRQLDRVAADNGVHVVRLAEPHEGPMLSDIGKRAVDRRAKPAVSLSAEVDLTLDEASIYGNVRKSFKSLINWGRRNLRLEYVNAEEPDRPRFESMRTFHKLVAGKETRSADSWSLQFEEIASGRGEVTLAYDRQDDALVASTMVIDGHRDAVYFSAVYDRARFDRPLGHWPLYDAILRSKARGRSRFVLGALPDVEGGSEKEVNIGYFKRGFASGIRKTLVWEWRPT